jgi:hypothetical protein
MEAGLLGKELREKHGLEKATEHIGAQNLDEAKTRTHTRWNSRSDLIVGKYRGEQSEGSQNSRTLCIELINREVTLLERMLMKNHRQVEGVTRGLIPLAKVIPHLRNSAKTHKLRGKLRQY